MKTETNKPTRASVQQFFRDCWSGYRDDLPESLALAAAEKELDDLRQRLLDVPAMKKLEAKVSKLDRSRQLRREEINKKVRKARHVFQTKGIVPELAKMLDEIVKEISG